MKLFLRIIFLSVFVVSGALPAMERAQEHYVKTRAQKRRQAEDVAHAEIIKKQKQMKTAQVAIQKEKETCPICWDDLSKQRCITLACHKTHRFHAKCIQAWREESELCPYRCAPETVQGADLPLVPIRIGTWERYLPSAVFGAIVLTSLACSQGYLGCSANHTFI
jgi:hypothetical protein